MYDAQKKTNTNVFETDVKPQAGSKCLIIIILTSKIQILANLKQPRRKSATDVQQKKDCLIK